MLILATVAVLAGLVVATVGVLGLRERLPRNRFFGVRTAATLRDEETFRLANRIAGLPGVAGGLVAVLAGLAGYSAGALIAALGLVGMLAIAIGGGVLGHRAALALPEPTPEAPAGCGGCACGKCVITSASN
ncbi:MAG TPA: SdpI family protein [Actinophytocola sp.]|uniref:SdpI family protein n=1 Tax=Actinophytocola sp. TaxID=1872138 RepID=UPI002DDD6B4F|nr:SdpI family protein [Actinophytocola sp.]HEV2778486.1 SdpI family protein [Actinophytocola sp.]